MFKRPLWLKTGTDAATGLPVICVVSKLWLPLCPYNQTWKLHARQSLVLHLNEVCDNHSQAQTRQGFIMTVWAGTQHWTFLRIWQISFLLKTSFDNLWTGNCTGSKLFCWTLRVEGVYNSHMLRVKLGDEQESFEIYHLLYFEVTCFM